MGMEAVCAARWPGGTGEVKALLESDALILHGAHRARIERADWPGAHVSGDELIVGEIVLSLGADRVAKWARKMATPPPSLANKLGLSAETPGYAIGSITEPALAEVLHGVTAGDPAGAALLIAMVDRPGALHATLAVADPAKPLWLVHPKGKAPFGETQVRDAMRAAGWMDNKVSAVSATWSATRYGWRGRS